MSYNPVMTTSGFFGYSSYQAYRDAFRATAKSHRIDPEQGATSSYQVVLINAAAQRRTHFPRMEKATRENAERCSPQTFYYFWDDDDPTRKGRVTLRRLRWVHWDNGSGNVDAQKLDRQARRDWWQYRDYWHGRCAVLTNTPASSIVLELYGLIAPPDVEALFNIRNECSARERADSIFMQAWKENRIDDFARQMRAALRKQLQPPVIQKEIEPLSIID